MSIQSLLTVFAGVMLALAFYMTARMRLRAMLSMFSAQSFLLAAFAALAARVLQEPHLLITAALTLGLKTWFLPWFLIRTAERTAIAHRLHSYLRPATTLLVASMLVLGAFAMTRSFIPAGQTEYLIAACALAMVMLGLLMLVSRQDMYGQIIGFLLMENGVFTFGLTLTGGMPLLVELGVFFDVTIGAVLMATLSYHVQREHESVHTDALTELVD